MQNDLKLWDKQPGESEPAYAAFEAYLKMKTDGGFRNVSALARTLSKSRQLLDGWKQKWNWQERCDAWDRDLLEKERKSALDERKKTAKNHRTIAIALQSKALTALKKAETDGWELKDIISALRLGTEIEKRALDLEASYKQLELANKKLEADIEKIRAEIRAGQAEEGAINIIDDIPGDA